MLTPRWSATTVRTSSVAKTSLIAAVCSVDVRLAMVMMSHPIVDCVGACDQAIRPAMWRCVKILRVLQWHHSSSKPSGGRSKSKAENPRRSEGTEGPGVRQALRHDNDAER